MFPQPCDAFVHALRKRRARVGVSARAKVGVAQDWENGRIGKGEREGFRGGGDGGQSGGDVVANGAQRGGGCHSAVIRTDDGGGGPVAGRARSVRRGIAAPYHNVRLEFARRVERGLQKRQRSVTRPEAHRGGGVLHRIHGRRRRGVFGRRRAATTTRWRGARRLRTHGVVEIQVYIRDVQHAKRRGSVPKMTIGVRWWLCEVDERRRCVIHGIGRRRDGEHADPDDDAKHRLMYGERRTTPPPDGANCGAGIMTNSSEHFIFTKNNEVETP